jgi:hypothetical protein
MPTDYTNEQHYGRLAGVAKALRLDHRTPLTVLAPLAALVGHAPIVYADHNLVHDLQSGMRGTAIVITDKLVIRCVVDGALFVREQDEPGNTANVSLATWPRRALTEVRIDPTVANNAGTWHRKWDQPWPPPAEASLRYGDHEIRLPLEHDHEPTAAAFSALLPKLLADLATT